MHIYETLEKLLDKHNSHNISAKALVYKDKKQDSKKRVLLPILEGVIKYQEVIREILRLSDYRRRINSMTLVLCYEILFGKNKELKPIEKNHKLNNVILELNKRKTRLKAEMVKYKLRNNIIDDKNLIEKDLKQLPYKYLRINTRMCNLEEIVGRLQSIGYQFTNSNSAKYVRIDNIVSNLLAVSNDEVKEILDNKELFGKRLIPQDKSSCLPVSAIEPLPKNSIVIDCCAAPGNKTLQLSSTVTEGLIYAFEKDAKRAELLGERAKQYRCNNVKVINKDFLKADPDDENFSKAEYIVLDPTCTNSGVFNQQIDNSDNLKKLVPVQLSLLKHCLKFKNVKKIVYSTCSVYQQENENLIQQVLNYINQENLKFSLCQRSNVIPAWDCRGSSESLLDKGTLDCFVRTDPTLHSTNGVFVAVLEKIE